MVIIIFYSMHARLTSMFSLKQYNLLNEKVAVISITDLIYDAMFFTFLWFIKLQK